uniref:Uncharacterized protein n=1 Tax=Knipowitschia caucasica TaxID=637954 RepID=A0AAV2KJ69_KNICA
MSGSGSGSGSEYEEGELVKPYEEDAQSSHSQDAGQREDGGVQGGPSFFFDRPRWGPVYRRRVVWRGVGALGRGGLVTSAVRIGALGRGSLDPSAVCFTFGNSLALLGEVAPHPFLYGS